MRFGLFTGKLRLADCGRADIFALIHYGIAIIDGAEHPKTGFTGLMFHGSAFPLVCLVMQDNQDVVVGDYYMEGSSIIFSVRGGNVRAKAASPLGASKISSKDGSQRTCVTTRAGSGSAGVTPSGKKIGSSRST